MNFKKRAGLFLFFFSYFAFANTVFAVAPGNYSTGLDLWFKAGAETSTTTDGAAVSSWGDQSVNNTDAVQATGAAQPAYYSATHANAMNYNPTLLFDGTTDYMTHDDSNLPVSAAPRTFFYAGYLNATPGTGTDVFYSYGNTTNGAKMSLDTSTSNLRLFASGNYLTATSSNTFTAAIPFIGIGRFLNSADSSMDINGRPGATTAVAATVATVTSSFDGFIGSTSGAAASNFLAGRLSELAIYDSDLGAENKERIQSYFALKYGITLEGLQGRDELVYAINDGSGGTTSPSLNVNYGQTFTATTTDSIEYIMLAGSVTGTPATVNLYFCTGAMTANACEAAPENSTNYTVPVLSGTGSQYIIPLTSPFPVTAGNTYTLSFENTGTGTLSFQTSSTDVYAGGDFTNLGSINTTKDLSFRLMGGSSSFTGTPDYVASDGATLMWNASFNTAYNNDIAGIGQDDDSALDQTKSKSQNADGVMILSAATSQDNLDFLVAGNDGGAATFTTTGAPSGYGVLTRKWMSQEAGETGTVTVAFDVADTGFDIPASSLYYLVVDTDNDSSLADETPQQLFDNATSGDEVSSDNIYSLSGIDLEQGTLFTIANPVIPLSGTVYSDLGVTNIGAGITVRLLKNGVDTGLTADTDASGYYEININSASIVADDILTLFLDNETPNGVTVTRAIGPVSHTGIDIYQSTVIVRSETATGISNTNLDTANSGDTDITALYSNGTTTAFSGTANTSLYVWAGDTYTPGGTTTLSATNGSLYVYGTMNPGASSVAMGGNFYVDNAGTFTHTGNLAFNGNTLVTYNQGDDPITSNVTVSSTLGTAPTPGIRVVTNPMSVNNLTMGAGGYLSLNGNNLTVGGTFTHNSSANIYLRGSETVSLTQFTTAGAWVYTGDGDGLADTYTIKDFGAIDYFTLGIFSTDGTTDTFELGSTLNTGAGISVLGGTFTTNGNSVTTTTAFTQSGTIASTVNLGSSLFTTGTSFSLTSTGGAGNPAIFNADSSTMSIGTTFSQTGTSPSTSTFNAGSGSLTIGTNFTKSGTGSTFNGSTATMTVNGNFSATSGGPFNAPTSTLTIGGNMATTSSPLIFNANGGTVVMTPNTNHALTGSTITFNNFTFLDTGLDNTDSTLTLFSANTYTITGVLTLDGTDADDRVNIVSSSPGTGTAIAFTGSATFSGDFLDITDNGATDSSTGISLPILPANSIDGGNTSGWFGVFVEFSTASASSTDESAANNFPVLLIRGQLTAGGTINVDMNGGTATSGGTDYTFTDPTTITIPAGTYDGLIGTSIAITAPTLNQDALIEGNETITFTLNGISISTIVLGDANSDTTTNSNHTYTITDDDASVVVEFSATSASSTNEGTANNFPVLLVNGTLGSSATIDVDITGGSATGGGTDYTSTDPISVTIPAGTYDGTAGTAVTITVPTLVQDSIVESSGETITLSLTNPSGVSVGDANSNTTTVSTHTYTITDDDTLLVEFTTQTPSGGEATASPTISLTVGGAIIASSVTVEISDLGTGTATSGGTDYTFASPMTVTIPAGNYTTASAVLSSSFSVAEDVLVEGNETIMFVLQNPTGVSLGDADGNATNESTATYTITDNDVAGVTVELSSATASSGTEAAGSAPNFPTLLVTGTLTVARSVQIDTTGGTATSSGTDYTYTDPLTITIPVGTYDGTTATDIVFTAPTIVADTLVEGNETITFTLINASTEVTIGDANTDTTTQSTHTYTITDDDTLLVEFTTQTPSALESVASPSWTLTVSGATISSPATIEVVNLGTGSATSGGTDFTFASPVTITIPAGNYTTASTISITGLTIVEDLISEVGGEDIDFDLQNAVGVTEGDADGNATNESTATFTITDNDSPAVTITESAGSTNITEGGATDTYTIALSTTPSSSVSITLTPNAECTVSPVGPLTFTTTAAQTVTVTAVDDGNTEGAHTCTINHAATSLDLDYNAIVIADVVAAVTDNDTPAVIVAGSPVTVKEADPNTAQITDTFTVALATAPASDVTIVLTLSNSYIDLTDTDETNLASITLTFTPLNYATPQTVTVTPIDDTLYNGTRSTDVSFAATSLDGNYNAIVVSDLSVTVNDGDDEDGDGVDNSVEAANPFNAGDGNGDGTPDADQQSVSGAPNPVTGDYTTLEAGGACVFITENAFVAESSLAVDDTSFEYPVGLVDFQVECPGPGMSSNVTIFYTENYDVSDWTYKKYDSFGNVYSDISGIVTFGTALVGTDTVTTVSFTVTDGDPATDEDGVADNFINDPSGPAVPVVVASNSGTSGSIRRICTDPTATNYAGAGVRGRSTPSLCRYEESQPSELTPLLDLIGGGEPNVPAEFSDYVCERYLKAYIMQGKENDKEEVKKLQEFLNLSEGEKLAVDGTYDADDIAAVNRFQTKYADQILAPWGIDAPTGNVYRTTTAKINIMLCSTQKGCPYFNEYLKSGNESIEAVKVQDFINIIFAPTSGYPTAGIPLSKTFGPQTTNGVKEFQTVYKDIVLKPWNLTSATGYWYKTTRHAANRLMNCNEGAIILDNGVSYE